jgi:hypothetical protein
MKAKVYVLIEGDRVEVYHNLKHLTDNNRHIPYYKAYRGLLENKSSYKTDKYSIHPRVIKYTTKRHIPIKEAI